MGPYCNFCGRRCFVHNPMRGGHLLATCKAGQELDKERLGYCWDEVKDSPETRRSDMKTGPLSYTERSLASYCEVNRSEGVVRIVGCDGITIRERRYLGRHRTRNALHQADLYLQKGLIQAVVDVDY